MLKKHIATTLMHGNFSPQFSFFNKKNLALVKLQEIYTTHNVSSMLLMESQNKHRKNCSTTYMISTLDNIWTIILVEPQIINQPMP
jgi:hypothetical protein